MNNYLQNLLNKYREEKIELEKIYQKNKKSIFQLEEYLKVLKNSIDVNFEVFTPLNINNDINDKISDLQNNIRALREKNYILVEKFNSKDDEINELNEFIKIYQSQIANLDHEKLKSLEVLLLSQKVQSISFYEHVLENLKKLLILLSNLNLCSKTAMNYLYSSINEIEKSVNYLNPLKGDIDCHKFVDQIFYNIKINSDDNFIYEIVGDFNFLNNTYSIILIDMVYIILDIISNINCFTQIHKILIENTFFEYNIEFVNNNKLAKYNIDNLNYDLLDKLLSLLNGEFKLENNSLSVYVPIIKL